MEKAFWVLAVSGTAIFVIKLFLLLVGSHGDLDSGGVGDGGDVGHGDGSTAAFKMLSIQAAAVFGMGAGWAGLLALGDLGLEQFQAVLLAALVGFAFVWLMGKLMRLAMGFESSGTIDVRNAIGRIGTVYARIPSHGAGQIQVALQGRLMTLPARTSGQEITTGTQVKIKDVDSAGNLMVTPA